MNRKRAALVLLLLPLLLACCGATLTMRGTSPLYDNGALTCTATPLLVQEPVGAYRVVHFRWTGPVAGEDSVVAGAGSTATITRQVPAGTYTVCAWASDSAGFVPKADGTPCDTCMVKVVKGGPHKVQLLP